MSDTESNAEAVAAGTTEAPADSAPSTEPDYSALYDKLTQGQAEGQGDTAPVEETEAEGAAEGVDDTDQSPQTDAEPEGEAQAIARPAAWSAEKEQVWQSLPTEAKEYIAQRESEAHKQISRLGETAKRAEPVLKALDDFPETFKAKGIDPAEGVRILMRAQELLDTDPVSGIAKIAKSYGVDLGTLASGTNRDIAAMRQELAELRTQQRLRQQQEQAQTHQGLEQRVAKWAEDKEHYSAVEADMVALIDTIDRSGKSEEEILDEAYQRAIWANPDVREKLVAKQREEEAAKAAKAQRAADAKKNRVSNMGTAPANLPFIKDGKFDYRNTEDMAKLYDAIVSQE